MSAPKVLSLYTGAGGLDYGFEAAGFETVGAVEINHDSCETIRANRRSWHVFEGSIFDAPTKVMLAKVGMKCRALDVLIGGPPCQPFSKAGYWVRGDSLRLDDPRANTLAAYLRVVEEALPRVFLLENVEGLAYSGKDEGLKSILTGVDAINQRTGSNYRPVVKVLNAAEFGVPQLRERAFVIAQRDGRAFDFPEPTHGPASSDGGGGNGVLPFDAPRPSYRTCWDAIGDLEPDPGEDLRVRGKWADLLPSIPEGQNYLWHTDRSGGLPLFGWRRRYWTFLLKLAKAKPSWTIQAQPGPAIGPFHWDNRRLSIRELCRLQTFPDDVQPVGGRTSVQRQLGNAVPSLLAEVLARKIRTQLLGLPELRTPLKLLPPARDDLPPPRKPAAVPSEFLQLQGLHAAHPGTGKGYRASVGPSALRDER